MKRIAAALVCLIAGLAFLLGGCGGNGGYSVTNPIGEITTPNLLALTYTNFDGVKFGEFYPVGEGEMVEFRVYVQTEEGSLSIFVTPEDNEEMVVYEARDISTSEFTFVLDEPGEYKLWLEGADHKGGYTIEAAWKAKP